MSRASARTPPGRQNEAVIEWLLQGDPAIRWQVLRDLVHAAPRAVDKERQQTAREGWGARLLALQDPEGTWAQGFYNPKWTSTTYTLLLLRDFGLPPSTRQAQRACAILLDHGLKSDGGVNFVPQDRSETCVTGMTLSLLSYFQSPDERLDQIAAHLLREQMPDGGWNCRRPRGATHSSLNTTISVLEGLRLYQSLGRRPTEDIRMAQQRGREFLLVHRLFRSHRTGKVIKSEFTRLSFPPRWHYDILRALDYFQATNAPADSRVDEAIELIRRRRRPNGRWRLEHYHRGRTFFTLERVGDDSRWITLQALRALEWWERGGRARQK